MVQLKPDLCVIGAGSGGLSVASAAAQLGVDVVLIERHKMGGDCLNYGCVPSKALLAAAKRAQAMREAHKFGIRPVEPEIDMRAVQKHIQDVIATIAPNDSVERYTGMGVKVILAEGKFRDRSTVIAGDAEIHARRFVIATGSSPHIPLISGLQRLRYFTNETIFSAPGVIRHLVIIGGGPVGLEFAQAYRRLGSEVSVIDQGVPLAKDDPEMRRPVLNRLAEEGVRVVDQALVERVEQRGGNVRAVFTKDGRSYSIDGTHLLVATGRHPNFDFLNLEAAGIRYDPDGIIVNSRLKTSNRRVYAIGDAINAPRFTHVANYHAGLVIRNALFRLPVRTDHLSIPWVTFTDPELAHVGLTEEGARKRHGDKIQVLRWPYNENDRAQAERETEGFLKVITTRSGRILGASMVGHNAGELIQMWSLAMQKGIDIKAMASITSPYPTLAEINKRAATMHFVPKLTSPLPRRIIGWLAKLG
jgi:pyruvate/2-oxoglutarate dehydrogenase complex dihydrolipoamide dehydrogenase (E3) component